MAVGDNLTVLATIREIGAVNPAGSNCTLARALGAGVAESMTVPTNAKFVRLCATAAVYVNFFGTAAVPADVTDGTAAMLLGLNWPETFFIPAGCTAISVISSGSAVVTGSFWAQ